MLVASHPNGRERGRPQRALRLTLTEPEVVPITEHQYRQAVEILAAMIVDWVQRPDRTAYLSDDHTGGEEPTPDPPRGRTTAPGQEGLM